MTPQPSQEGSARVILVPYPVSVLSSFAYYVFRQTGASSPYVFYRWRNLDKDQDSAVRLCLFGPMLFVKILSRLQTLSQAKTWHLRRVFNFCNSPDRVHRATIAEMQKAIALLGGSPLGILEQCARYWKEVISAEVDPFKSGLPTFRPSSDIPLEEPLPTDIPRNDPKKKGDRVFVSRPKFDGANVDETGHSRVIGSTRFSIQEPRIKLLLRRSLAIGVFGPSSVGKSTTVRSLVDEMQNFVDGLAERSGIGWWNGFDLTVDRLDLDLGTPTQGAIEEGEGQNRQRTESDKRPWTMELADEALRRLSLARRMTNILIVDLPGRADDILEVIGSSLDGSILLIPSGDTGLKAEWGKYLDSTLALERLSNMASFKPGEGKISMARPHSHHRTARGHIVGLERLSVSYDPFFGYLAKVLLCDLLPEMVEKRHEARIKFLR